MAEAAPAKKYISFRELARRHDRSESHTRKLTREGKLPQPVKLGARCVRFRLSDIEQWEAQQEQASLQPEGVTE